MGFLRRAPGLPNTIKFVDMIYQLLLLVYDYVEQRLRGLQGNPAIATTNR